MQAFPKRLSKKAVVVNDQDPLHGIPSWTQIVSTNGLVPMEKKAQSFPDMLEKRAAFFARGNLECPERTFPHLQSERQAKPI